METIFIVEHERAERELYEVWSQNKEVSGKLTGEALISTFATAALFAVPGGIFGTAIGAGVAKSVSALFAKKTLSKAETESVEAEIKALHSATKKIQVTRSMAFDKGYKFPPGHPQSGIFYRIHPLAKYAKSDKQNVYIPESDYSKVLLEERESELLRLLVDLGAIKISIKKKSRKATSNNFTTQASVELASSAGGGINGGIRTSDEQEKENTRTFLLRGKKWHEGDTVNKREYSWLFYESSWRSVINAREVGGCINAAIEINEASVYSKDINLGLEMKSKMIEAGVGGGFSSTEDFNSSYLVEVEFNHPEPDKGICQIEE